MASRPSWTRLSQADGEQAAVGGWLRPCNLLSVVGLALLGAVLGTACGRYGKVAWRGGLRSSTLAATAQHRGPTQVVTTASELTLTRYIAGLSEETLRKSRYAVCIVDKAQASDFLGQAIASIHAATAGCSDADGHQGRQLHAACASQVTAAMAWTSAYAASALQACGQVPAPKGGNSSQLGAECLADVSALVAQTGEFAFQASVVKEACDGGSRPNGSHPVLSDSGAYLGGGADLAGLGAARQADNFFRVHDGQLEASMGELRARLRVRTPTGPCLLDGEAALRQLQLASLHMCPQKLRHHGGDCAADAFTAVAAAGRAAALVAHLAHSCPAAATGKAAKCGALAADLASGISELKPPLRRVLKSCQAGEALLQRSSPRTSLAV